MKQLFARALVVLLASILQFHQLGRESRFHPDEAHFMTFARGAAVNGDWMLPGALDKPPLTIYFSASGMVAFGIVADANGVLHLDPLVGEFAARVPNVMMAIMLAALIMRLSWRSCRNEGVTMLAGLLAATSSALLAFGATAFTDMGLLFWAVLSLVLLKTRKYGGAGVALGLAFWCKQQALLALPLYGLLLIARRENRAAILRFAFPLTILLLLLLLWDAARPETSLFVLGTANNAPQQWLADPADWLARLLEWLRLGSWLLGPPLVTLLLVGAAIVSRFLSDRQLPNTYGRAADARVYAVFVLAYLALHTVLTVNQYDRYLLLLAPLLILLVAAPVTRLVRRPRYGKRVAATAGILLLMFAFWSMRSGVPLGGDRGENNGIDDLAAYLNDKPVATVIYDPWLGWELGYYLGQWNNKRRVHYPTAAALVTGALALDEVEDRYLVAPLDRARDEWVVALRAAGFAAEIDYQRDRFVVYRISRTPEVSSF